MITIYGTKQKEETYGLIATAWHGADVGGDILIVQSNDMGGKSLQKTIEKHGFSVFCESKNKARYITIIRELETPNIINKWLEYTQLTMVEATGFYSKPGLFGWNKVDVGSKILVDKLPELKGIGADFGCGYGYLTRHILDNNVNVTTHYALDLDERAVEACGKNITDDRAIIRHADCTQKIVDLPPLDFVIMNPPFHDGDGEDRGMGQKFIETAAKHLKRKGVCWIVANKHMPYEKTISEHFHAYEKIAEEKGFKIFKALK